VKELCETKSLAGEAAKSCQEARWETWPSQSQFCKHGSCSGSGWQAAMLSSFCGTLQFSRRKCSARIWTPSRKSEVLHSIYEQAATISHWLHFSNSNFSSNCSSDSDSSSNCSFSNEMKNSLFI